MSSLIVGRQPVLEALRSTTSLDKIILTHGVRGAAILRIRQLARQRGVPVSEVERGRFEREYGQMNAQGVAAVIASRAYVEVDEILAVSRERGEQAFVVVLDEIEDPHNLGALIRTAECAGAHGVIIPKHHAARISEAVAKTSAGASLHLPIARVANIAQTLEELKESGVWIVGADMNGSRLYFEVDYSGPIAIVIGGEGRGMRRLVQEKCDFVVKIPLYGKVESLNASVAGALIFYEVVRMRRRGR